MDPDQRPAWLGFLLISIPVLLLLGFLFFVFGQKGTGENFTFEVDRFSGKVALSAAQDDAWTEVTRASMRDLVISVGDRIKTEGGADIDLSIPEMLNLRIKPDSAWEFGKVKGPGFFSKGAAESLRLNFFRGTLLGITREDFGDRVLAINTPHSVVRVNKGSFLIQIDDKGATTITVLDGALDLSLAGSNEAVQVPALHAVEFAKDAKKLGTAERVTYQNWRDANEVRDLVFETREETEKQVSLMTRVGNAFRFVFDEGTFFTPNMGYTKRDFIVDEGSGEVILQIEYDVYPQNSLVGIYLKTRELDLSKQKRIRFEARAVSDRSDAELSPETLPKMFRLEVKKRFETVRGYAVKPIEPNWRLYSFDFNEKKETIVNEIVFAFENTRIGPLSTKGTVQFKNIEIE